MATYGEFLMAAVTQLLTQLEYEVGKFSEQVWGISTSVVNDQRSYRPPPQVDR
jgi:hypothetical protein